MEHSGLFSHDNGLQPLHPSATSEMLLLRIAVLQLECLNALFCSRPTTEGLCCPCDELDAFEVETTLRSIRLSVGLPDFPDISYANIDSPDSWLRERLPCQELLKAEASLAASFSSDGAPGSRLDGEAFDRTTNWIAGCAFTSTSKGRLLCSPSRRLPHILLQLLRLIAPRCLQKQIYNKGLPSNQVNSLKPAGKLLVAFLEFCIQPPTANGITFVQEKTKLSEDEERERPLPAAEMEEMNGVFGHISLSRARSREGSATNKLRRSALRLRAELEALDALEGIAILSPGAALLELERLMQQPQLQHLEHLQHPPPEVLSAVFYECLLRCFASASVLPIHCHSASAPWLVGSICRDLLRRSGLWDVCCHELLPDATDGDHKCSCRKEGCVCCSQQDNADNGLPHAARNRLCEKLLLTPPENCSATAKAFCCFLNPDARPYSPWLCRPPLGCHSRKARATDRDAVTSACRAPEENRQAALPQPDLRPPRWRLTKYTQCFASHRLPAELRALDEELRPLPKEQKAKRQLHRLLVKWLKTKSWAEGMGLAKLSGSENYCFAGENAGCKEQQNERLFPLLLPYGSSVTGFGDWSSDLDLSLLLPSSCRGGCVCTVGKANESDSGQTGSRGAPAQASASSSDSQMKPTTGCSSPASCCSPSCNTTQGCRGDNESTQNTESKTCPCEGFSRGEAAEVLTRLQKLICAEPQLHNVITDVEVVVPASAPPVLRGVYLQRRRPKANRQWVARRLMNSEGNIACNQLSCTQTDEHQTKGDEPGENNTMPRMGDGTCPNIFELSSNLPAAKFITSAHDSARGPKREDVANSSPVAGGPHPCISGNRSITSADLSWDPPASRERLPEKDEQHERESQEHRPCPTAKCGSPQSDEKARGETGEPRVRVEFEVTVGSALGPLNSLLLCTYGRRCHLLQPLARIVKHWADCRGLTGTREGNIASYAWSLLVVFFALSTSPALVPNLQAPHCLLSGQRAEQPLPSRSQRCFQRDVPFQIPVEYVYGCHSVWFLNTESPNRLGSRALDLLRNIYRGSTEDRLLQRLQHYVPGHVLLVPEAKWDARDHSATEKPHLHLIDSHKDSQNGQNPWLCAAGKNTSGNTTRRINLDASMAAGEGPLASLFPSTQAGGKPPGTLKQVVKSNRRHNGWWPQSTDLSQSEWTQVASLFHAFFAFYGYYFNACSQLASLRIPFLYTKHSLRSCNPWGCCTRRRHCTICTLACQPVFACSCWSCEGRRPFVQQRNLRNPCMCNEQTSRQGTAAEVEQGEREEPTADHKWAFSAASHGNASSSAHSSVQVHAKEWNKIIVEGKELQGPPEKVFRILREKSKGVGRSWPSACGIDVEDPMEAGRILRFRKPEGADRFFREVRRAERLLRKESTTLEQLFTGE